VQYIMCASDYLRGDSVDVQGFVCIVPECSIGIFGDKALA
jgi:hypothetical protein